MNWDEKAADQAAATIPNPPSPTATELSRARGRREGFVWGARWQRWQYFLLSDEAILRALNAEEPRAATDNLADWGESSIARMRRALTAAIGGGDE